ncbi:hypothetical protein H4Q26_007977 [Puccinia striiformis f. sp. tritici PST-130]|nr:hypothetical protein H4Q26_007977 [Puccinia striiformis f. sp. tritici PST-130]
MATCKVIERQSMIAVSGVAGGLEAFARLLRRWTFEDEVVVTHPVPRLQDANDLDGETSSYTFSKSDSPLLVLWKTIIRLSLLEFLSLQAVCGKIDAGLHGHSVRGVALQTQDRSTQYPMRYNPVKDPKAPIKKNPKRLGTLPNPTSTKLSGLGLNSEYTFNLVMKTTGGSINSQQIKVKTNSLQDTSGINVGFGVILPGQRSTSSPKKQSNSSRVEMVRQDPNRYHTFRLDHGLPGTTSAKPSTFSSLAYQCALSVIDPKRWYRYLLIISKPYHHPCRVHQRGTPSGRPRSAGKPQINSSNPISPANNNEINSSSACRQNARANSAPASPTLSESGMLEDQSEENIHRSCIVVEDGGDVDNLFDFKEIGPQYM